MTIKQTTTANGNGEARVASQRYKASASSDRKNSKFLTFFLAGEEYGIEILKVQEIIGMMTITPVPRTPHFIRGVINLRGKVITVVDLRLKFDMESKEQTEETCIIVVQTAGIQIGCVVDKVSEVLDINAEEIVDAPSFGADVNTEYILGIGKSQGKVKLLLDIDRVLSKREMHATQLAASEGTVNAAGGDKAPSEAVV
jgi:purine-binding chemotaxis protein CheW